MQNVNEHEYNLNGVPYNPADTTRTQEGFAKYIAKTYLWMFIGLFLSFGIGLFMYVNSGSVISFITQNFSLYLGATIGSVILVIVLALGVNKMPPTAAKVLFLVYASVFGIILTPTLLIYQLSSVIYVLAVTSAIYLVLAVIGLTTKRDMSKFGHILAIALFGLLIYSVISMFFIRSTMNQMLIGLAGIAIFMGFTVYDSHRIKRFYFTYQGNEEMLEKTTIISALQLYLDYVNLFLYMLRFLGKRK